MARNNPSYVREVDYLSKYLSKDSTEKYKTVGGVDNDDDVANNNGYNASADNNPVQDKPLDDNDDARLNLFQIGNRQYNKTYNYNYVYFKFYCDIEDDRKNNLFTSTYSFNIGPIQIVERLINQLNIMSKIDIMRKNDNRISKIFTMLYKYSFSIANNKVEKTKDKIIYFNFFFQNYINKNEDIETVHDDCKSDILYATNLNYLYYLLIKFIIHQYTESLYKKYSNKLSNEILNINCKSQSTIKLNKTVDFDESKFIPSSPPHNNLPNRLDKEENILGNNENENMGKLAKDNTLLKKEIKRLIADVADLKDKNQTHLGKIGTQSDEITKLMNDLKTCKDDAQAAATNDDLAAVKAKDQTAEITKLMNDLKTCKDDAQAAATNAADLAAAKAKDQTAEITKLMNDLKTCKDDAQAAATNAAAKATRLEDKLKTRKAAADLATAKATPPYTPLYTYAKSGDGDTFNEVIPSAVAPRDIAEVNSGAVGYKHYKYGNLIYVDTAKEYIFAFNDDDIECYHDNFDGFLGWKIDNSGTENHDSLHLIRLDDRTEKVTKLDDTQLNQIRDLISGNPNIDLDMSIYTIGYFYKYSIDDNDLYPYILFDANYENPYPYLYIIMGSSTNIETMLHDYFNSEVVDNTRLLQLINGSPKISKTIIDEYIRIRYRYNLFKQTIEKNLNTYDATQKQEIIKSINSAITYINSITRKITTKDGMFKFKQIPTYDPETSLPSPLIPKESVSTPLAKKLLEDEDLMAFGGLTAGSPYGIKFPESITNDINNPDSILPDAFMKYAGKISKKHMSGTNSSISAGGKDKRSTDTKHRLPQTDELKSNDADGYILVTSLYDNILRNQSIDENVNTKRRNTLTSIINELIDNEVLSKKTIDEISATDSEFYTKRDTPTTSAGGVNTDTSDNEFDFDESYNYTSADDTGTSLNNMIFSGDTYRYKSVISGGRIISYGSNTQE